MKKDKIIVGMSAFIAVLTMVYSCREPDLNDTSTESEWLSGGGQTVFDNTVTAFSSPFPSLTGGRSRVHDIGDGAFGSTFVSAPAPVHPGLGPIFNNVSCTSCHIGDGRGKPPENGEQISSLLIRLSLEGTDEHNGPVPVPGFGLQLQQRAITSSYAEANVSIGYTEQSFKFPDDSTYALRTPTYTIINPYTAMPAGVLISPRIAPPVFGLGLLEAIPEGDILSRADEDDLNGDGISGKPNYVWDVVSKKSVLGRFGWKANNTTLLQQSAGAYNQDMGITNFVFPQESSYGQTQYDGLDPGYQVSDSLLTSVVFYIRSLGVPVRRNADSPDVLNGKQVFMSAQCGACHVPRSVTQVDVSFPEISSQVIFPYTDLLLHDMGAGLADNRPDYLASGQEWRTPPLWGIGLTKVVNGHNNFLHDGRARSVTEAIMWHGGEAEKAKQFVSHLSTKDRADLIKFLQSL